MPYEFYAFISYKRGEADEKWARRVQAELEHYRIPVADLRGKTILGQEDENVPPKRLKVFRDKSDLGSNFSVEDGLSENLDVSRFLIVICSRRSAQSPYVDAEVRRFVETGRKDQIVPLVIDASAADLAVQPPSLPADVEPVVASGEYEDTFIHLLARLLRVDHDNLRQVHLRAARRRAAFRLSMVAAVLFLTAGLALWAVSAEKRATERRIQSEELVDFLTFDLVRECQNWLPAAKMSSIIGRVREYYEKWEAHSPRAALAQAVNLRQQGDDAELIHGDTPEAMVLTSRAVELLEGLHENNPDDETILAEYNRAFSWMASLFVSAGEQEKAVAHYRHLLERVRDFSKKHPDSLPGKEQVADSLKELANLMTSSAVLDRSPERKEKFFEEADALYREGGDLWREMIGRWPRETQTWLWRMNYGYFLSDRAYGALLRNNFNGSLDYSREAMEIFEKFYDEEPRNLTVRLLYADEVSKAAFIATKWKALEPADEFVQVGEQLWRELAADDPRDQYFYGWVGIMTTGGLLRIEQGREDEAEVLLNEAEKILGSLIRMRPEDEAYLTTKGLIEEYRELARQKSAGEVK